MIRLLTLVAVFLSLVLSAPVWAQSTIVEHVVANCEPEIKAYCSEVMPGNGRALACFYAHEDKLSVQCINALYDGMVALERFVEVVSYVAGQCEQDIDAICDQTVPGEGRVAACLLDNKTDLTASCSSAIDDVGLEVQ